MVHQRLIFGLCIGAISLLSCPAPAAISFDVGGRELSDSGAEALSADAITLIFEDSTDEDWLATSQILVTIDASALFRSVPAAKVKQVYFNVRNDLIDPTGSDSAGGFSITQDFDWTRPDPDLDRGAIGTAAVPSLDAYRAAGIGAYDFLVGYQNSLVASDPISRWSVTRNDAGILSAMDFLEMSTPRRGNAPYLAAAHVISLPDESGESSQSGWYGADPVNLAAADSVVPEPASLLVWSILGLSFLGCAARYRRKRKQD